MKSSISTLCLLALMAAPAAAEELSKPQQLAWVHIESDREALQGLPRLPSAWATSPPAETSQPPANVATYTERLEKGLKQLLAERQSWGTEPSQAAADVTPAQLEVALKAQLAERESWGTQPSSPTVTQVAPAQLEIALKAQLAERESWGTQPSSPTVMQVAPAQLEAALKAYLAQRDTWAVNPSPTVVQVPAERLEAALTKLLAERNGWSATSAGAPRKLVKRVSAQACSDIVRAMATTSQIHFESSSANLAAESVVVLDKLAHAAAGCGRLHIKIMGHTDASGSQRSNMRLSQRRAQAVADYLKRVGLKGSRLSAVGYGASKPIAANDTEQHRAMNRRIELSVESL